MILQHNIAFRVKKIAIVLEGGGNKKSVKLLVSVLVSFSIFLLSGNIAKAEVLTGSESYREKISGALWGLNGYSTTYSMNNVSETGIEASGIRLASSRGYGVTTGFSYTFSCGSGVDRTIPGNNPIG